MSTDAKPASRSMASALCSPQTVPSPAPFKASDTVMQCMVDIPYRNGPKGWSMLLLEIARRTDVDHEEGAVPPQGPGDLPEDVLRLGLVVDHVEGGDQVVALRLAERGHVTRREADVRVPERFRFRHARPRSPPPRSRSR